MATPGPETRRRWTPWLIGLVAVLAVVVVVLVVVLLSRDDGSAPAPTTTPTAAPTPTASPTPSPSPSPSPTPSPTASPTGLPEASLGPFSGGTDPGLASTWIADIRSAAQTGYDRVVFELTGVVPPYRVEYADPPFVAISGEEVEVDGAAFVRVRLERTSTFDLDEGVPVYEGPRRVTSDTEVVTEVVDVEDFEGVVVWVIGLDEQRPLRVWTLDDPSRLVIDVEQ